MENKSATKSFFKIFGILSLALLGIGILYLTIFLTTPLKMHEYTLSNGKQTIIFQEMVHIGETSFYEKVDQNLKNYRKEGYVYAYEQVSVNTKEDAEKLTELTGLSVDTYGLLAGYLQLDNQKNHMSHVTPEDINADMSASELIELIETYQKENPDVAELDMNIETALNDLKEGSDTGKSIIKALMRGMLKLARTNSIDLEDGLLKNVILKKRDQKLFEIITNLEAEKVVIHYGALHFEGFFQKLKEKDSNWKIMSKDKIEVF